jgi:hypothetical protein
MVTQELQVDVLGQCAFVVLVGLEPGLGDVAVGTALLELAAPSRSEAAFQKPLRTCEPSLSNFAAPTA